MGKVNTQEHAGNTAKLNEHDFEGDTTLLTISDYREVMINDDKVEGGKRKTGLLEFAEFGDSRVQWTTKEMLDAVVAHYGDESNDWNGKVIPVEKFKTGKGEVRTRVVGDAAEWSGIFKQAGVTLVSKYSKVAINPVHNNPVTAPKAKSAKSAKSASRGRGR